MKAVKCTKCSLFYDEDKYDACPHCLKASQFDGNTETVKAKKTAGVFSGLFSKKNKKAEDKVSFEVSEPKKSETSEEKTEQQTLSEAILNANSTERTTQACRLTGNAEPATGWLTCINGNFSGETFSIKTGKNYIEISDENVFVSKDGGEYSAVMIFEPKKRQFFIQNGNNENKLFVNSELVADFCELKSYDIIEISGEEFVFIALCGEKFSWDSYKKGGELK